MSAFPVALLRVKRAIPALLAGMAFTCCALTAHAGLFSDDEARSQLNTVRSRLDELTQRVDSRLESVAQHQGDFTNQIESLKADIAKLRGQVDELTYNLDATQKRQKDFYVDLDNRLRKIEAQGQTDSAAAADTPKAAETNPARDYEAALAALRASDYKSALRGFETFIGSSPGSAQLPAAYFFAAYCYSHLKLHAKAAEMYGRLVSTWPEDEHVPDAMLGRAESLESAGQKKEARAVLTKLAARFPASDAGKQAKAKLKQK